MTNVTFFVNRILQHPIGCVGINLPTYVKRNKAVIGLEKDHHGAVYRDNMCLFRCLALHMGREATALYAEYSDKDVHDFTGVTLDDLYRVETKFKTNVCVYKLVETLEEKTTAELVRRSLCHYPDTMYVNIYETHYSYIQDAGNVGTPCGNGSVTCIATKAFAKEELDEFIQEMCTSRRRRSFNAWTTRASLSSKI